MPTVQPFPDHKDMAALSQGLCRSFRHHAARINFKTRVTDVRPAAAYTDAKPRWLIETAAGATDEYDTRHRRLRPSDQAVRGRRCCATASRATTCTATTTRTRRAFAGKRICIVGVGNSSCDIASDLCTMAERTVLVGRSTPLIIPKLIFGRPFWDIVKPFYKPWVPAGRPHPRGQVRSPGSCTAAWPISALRHRPRRCTPPRTPTSSITSSTAA